MPSLAALRTALLFPVARIIVEALSWRQWFFSLGRKPVIHVEERYEGQPILLLALYEKGELRPDILRLLQTARDQGFYVLAVNTLRLTAPGRLRDLAHCYIERPNFGRDFGSYRTGFLHLYARGWERECPRLLMLNDSVFFSSRGLEAFLETMRDSTVEVLGATENHEIEYHIGSFCIAMAGKVLAAPRLVRFWKRYRQSDVRPKVIRRGEMGLSKALKRCASSPAQFRAIFDPVWFLGKMQDDPETQDLLLRNLRTADHTPAPRLGPKAIEAQLSGNTIRRRHGLEHHETRDKNRAGEIRVEATLADLDAREVVAGRDGLKAHLLRHVAHPSAEFDRILDRAIVAAGTEVFMRGSQIHQNALILLELGLPIVKLDLLFRGMFNIHDLLKLTAKLEGSEAVELSRLLMERPFGELTLFGWKRAAFMRGLI